MAYLVAAAGGLGNIIQTTPLVRELAAWGEVDFLVERTWPGAAELWQGWSVPRRVLTDRKWVSSDAYELIWYSGFVVPGIDGGIRGPSVKGMLAAGRSEWDMNLDVVRKHLGPLRLEPRAEVSISDAPALPWVALCPTAGKHDELKRWPHWRELATATPYNSVALGLTADDRYGWPVGSWHVGRAIGRPLNLMGDYRLVDVAAILRSASCVVANDCGLAHLAAALGRPTIVLFGPTSVVKNRPLGRNVRVLRAPEQDDCRPCQTARRWTPRARTCKHGRWCMDGLSVEQVMAAVDDVMGGG